jgi:hypothetical protein
MMMIMHQVVNPPDQEQRNIKGPLTLGFKQYHNTLNDNRYCQALQNLHTKAKEKLPHKCVVGIILPHNSHTHVPSPLPPTPTECHVMGVMGDIQTSYSHTDTALTYSHGILMSGSLITALTGCTF